MPVLKKYFLIAIWSVLALSIACNQQVEVEEKPESKTKSRMYEASELALLMREMRDDFAIERKNLEAGGNLNTDLIEKYKGIQSAKPTAKNDTVGPYHAFAKSFIAQLESVNESEDKIGQFNMAVQTCVSCHTQYCQGPIPSIKKLLLENPI